MVLNLCIIMVPGIRRSDGRSRLSTVLRQVPNSVLSRMLDMEDLFRYGVPSSYDFDVHASHKRTAPSLEPHGERESDVV